MHLRWPDISGLFGVSSGPGPFCLRASAFPFGAAQSAVSSVKDAVHFEKVVDQTTEATWTMPEEEKGAEPEVHTEEEHREE